MVQMLELERKLRKKRGFTDEEKKKNGGFLGGWKKLRATEEERGKRDWKDRNPCKKDLFDIRESLNKRGWGDGACLKKG